ncbi:MAG: putative secreted protein [uncultured Quadrisphaera sp.]|uniref:Putative secreted protein n=1 Tax=uncultured Quadrisphaera sp. TaxID=904978 RepID=A0A6J4QF98_9ACTN|nr:MAG: putative secreted protein [uncultured Quadrisphaera sp.]
MALTAASATVVAAPVGLSIPTLGVDASLVPLGVQADGSLEVPADAAQAGWFTGGATPGSRGPGVVGGHVDSVDGPGVFIGLEDLAPGDEVVVDREDGSRVAFVVTRTLRAPKDAFPTDEVYGPTAAPELRLITCGGPFDRSTGHYDDNLVVFAQLAA